MSAKPEITKVLEFLQEGNRLTSDEALEMWKIKSLPQVIKRLKGRGHEVKDYPIKIDGRNCKVYYLDFVL